MTLSDPLADFDREIVAFLEGAGVNPELVALETPAQREFGERATNVAFRLAKERRQPPRQIAEQIAAGFKPERQRFIAAIEPAGNGFVNFRLNSSTFAPHVLATIASAGSLYGRRPNHTAEKVVVEHTSVNPNKEWHIGHVRNAVLGDVVGRLFGLAGDHVEVQNYIDDTGLQAAEAIVGLNDFPEPQLPGEKFDHYAGRLYVKVASELDPKVEKELRARVDELESRPRDELIADEKRQLLSAQARLENIERLKQRVLQVMRALESGEFHPLTERILDGQLETAYRLGIFYDVLNWESNLVESHLLRDALQLLRRSPQVYQPQEGRYTGALVMQTGGAPEEPKVEVLVRSNGIPTYIAKDIAYHMWKFELLPSPLAFAEYSVQPNGQILWTTSLHGQKKESSPPDRVINVIAVNQSVPQQAVKEALRIAGYPEVASELTHLAYGLVMTAEGMISGRKGTAVAGDTIIDEAVRVARERVEERGEDLAAREKEEIAEAVGIGAVRYFMVQYNPLREIIFDVADVVSYDGNTALYIQYALVRMFAILRKAEGELGLSPDDLEPALGKLLQHEQERRLIYYLAQYPAQVGDATRTLAVNLIAEYAFELATIFSQFYRDCPVLSAEQEIRQARLLLVRAVRDVLVNAANMLGVPVIERL